MSELIEQGAGNLVRVIRDVKRKMKNGKTISYKRTFHVRQAQPGDRYSAAAGGKGGAPLAAPQNSPEAGAGEVDPGDGDVDQGGGEQAAAEQEQVNRISVQVLGIPWAPDERLTSKDVDPVPAEIRRKFDPKNRAMRADGPIEMEAPLNTVVAGDPMLWGAEEISLLDRMRSGRISRIRVHPGGSGTLIAEVEALAGYSDKVYLRMGALTSPWTYQAWGDLYDLRRGRGDCCKRAAASYEAAKAFGLDDLVAPTVLRFDEPDAFDSVLSDELMERRRLFDESLGRRTGESPSALKKRIKGFSSAQMFVKDTWTVVSEDWAHEMFSNGEDRAGEIDILNRIYEVLPEERRVAFLRVAALDFLVWAADRHLGDALFSDHDLHPVVFMASEVTMPNPAKLAEAAAKNGGDMVHPGGGEVYPLLWSDFAVMLAARGTEEELSDYEKLGADIAGRMTRDRMVEVGRTVTEHGVPHANAAGMLLRAKMLGLAARKLARNPILAAHHFGFLMGGEDPGLLDERDGRRILEEVNGAMKLVAGDEFDFVSSLKEKPK